MYGEGISREGSLLDVGIEHDVVQKSGAWFAYGDERLGQGRENAKQFLKEHDEVRERVLYDIYDKLGFNEPVDRRSARGAGGFTGGTGERRAALGGACGAGVRGSVVEALLHSRSTARAPLQLRDMP